MVSSSFLSKTMGTPIEGPSEYRNLAGALQYVVLTRPDITYVVNLDYGLFVKPSERLSLVGYVDANWGLDFDNRRSTTGYYIYFGDNPISWYSKKATGCVSIHS
ncbi:hypothetical protein EPI10_016973 [Gossypium australe]|uniref:Retrovirus-related Pol polyprotein from transposon TNT 1-94 n=1 Tax=Gossypium australe TaxID=47621 RepID=A0A5B6VQI2_9ROSI|nr:hypothetical protein EPI10_016973 [Gossypium australe]